MSHWRRIKRRGAEHDGVSAGVVAAAVAIRGEGAVAHEGGATRGHLRDDNSIIIIIIMVLFYLSIRYYAVLKEISIR